MRHQVQIFFRGISVGIPPYLKVYLVYVPHKRNVVSLYNVVFDESFSIALAYRSQTYAEAMDMRPAVS